MAAPIISKNIRVRHPDHFVVGDDSIVDDYCYFSTRVEVGRLSHVCTGCLVGGGGTKHLFRLGDYSSLSSGVKIWCQSGSYVDDLIVSCPPGIHLPEELSHGDAGDVILERCTCIGANSVVMPDNRIPEGVTIGALSFVPPRFPFEPWSVYAGIPLRKIKDRNKANVLAQLDFYLRALDARDKK